MLKNRVNSLPTNLHNKLAVFVRTTRWVI